MFGSWLAKAGTSPPLGSDSGGGTFPSSTPAKQRGSSAGGSGGEGGTVTAPTSAAAQPMERKSSKSEKSDYQKVFLPFNVKQGFEVAPVNRFLKRKQVVKLEVDDMDEDEAELSYAIDAQPDWTTSGELFVVVFETLSYATAYSLFTRLSLSCREESHPLFIPLSPNAQCLRSYGRNQRSRAVRKQVRIQPSSIYLAQSYQSPHEAIQIQRGCPTRLLWNLDKGERCYYWKKTFCEG